MRGSMVRRNLHHKISHNIEKLLAMRKNVCFFFSFSRASISLGELSVWTNAFLTSVYAKTCPFHGLFVFFRCIFSPGETAGSTSGPSGSSAVCLSEAHREFCVSSRCPKINNGKDNIHTVLRMGSSPQLFLCFLYFCFALLKGSFPTQFV